MEHQQLITPYTTRNHNKPNLLLIHGFLCSSHLWYDYAERFAKTFNIYLVNLPGHDGNGVTIQSISKLAQHLLKALDILRVNSLHIIGHSLGGYIAGEIAKLAPSRATTITLINSSLLEDSAHKKTDRDKAIRAVRITHSVFSHHVIEKLFSEKSRLQHQNIINQTQQAAANIKAPTIISYLEAMRDRESTLNAISKTPKLIIASQQDTTIPFSRVAPQFNSENTTSMILEESNHMSFIEESDLVYKAINSFFVSFSS
ncbi:MAG: alpha/beta hydrolase [Flavobacteriales bacterium]|jgi:pimeloyl-ACP methyl ester carboxylesterase|nr:alpha/beta hydrolase [Flavobacteriales bacterium]